MQKQFSWLVVLFCAAQLIWGAPTVYASEVASAPSHLVCQQTQTITELRPHTSESCLVPFVKTSHTLLELLHRRCMGQTINPEQYDLSENTASQLRTTQTRPFSALLNLCMQTAQQLSLYLKNKEQSREKLISQIEHHNRIVELLTHSYLQQRNKEQKEQINQLLAKHIYQRRRLTEKLKALPKTLYHIGTYLDEWVQRCADALWPLCLDKWLRYCAVIVSRPGMEDLIEYCVDRRYPVTKVSRKKRKQYHTQLVTTTTQTMPPQPTPITAQPTHFPFYYATPFSSPMPHITQPSAALAGPPLIQLHSIYNKPPSPSINN